MDVTSARDMLEAVEAALPADIFVGVAAVADWGVEAPAKTKIKKSKHGAPSIPWSENPDILQTVASHADRPELVVGFAAETDSVLEHARAKLARKGCDWILANDVSSGVFGSDRNQLTLVHADGEEAWPELAKRDAAARLAARIADHFRTR